MVLEATILCVDNSEWAINGDYLPSRLEAQRDAANVLCGAKSNDNPENSVGLLTMAGSQVAVRVPPTQDLGQMLQGLHDIPVGGNCDVIRGLQTAQLALKHRMNKNQKQRIVLFISSPITAPDKQLETIGKNLKKNNVQLDIVSFGETAINSDKLHKLHAAVNSNDTSHIIEISGEETSRILSDLLLGTPIMQGAEEAGMGVDPSVDPELFMALQMSLHEEQARQARNAQAAEQQAEGTAAEAAAAPAAPASLTSAVPTAAPGDIPTVADIEAMQDLDDELRQALILSLTDLVEPSRTANPDARVEGLSANRTTSVEHLGGGDVGIVAPEEAAAPMADANAEEKRQTDIASALQAALPGVNFGDPNVNRALEMLADAESDEDDSSEEQKEEKEDEM